MTTTAPARSRAAAVRIRLPLTVWLSLGYLTLCAVIVARPALVAPDDPLRTQLGRAHLPPSASHLFGTDHLGRDVFTRVVHGARYSLFIGVTATLLAVTIGVVLGVIAALGPRVADLLVSRIFDLIGAFPEILLALVLITLTGPGTANMILAIGIAAAPRFGRVMRAETAAVRGADYVTHARLVSASRVRIAIRHVLPNAVGSLPVLITLGLGASILSAAALSFLGFGPRPPLPEWGSMLAEARGDLRIAWWSVYFPGLAVTATVLATTVVGRYAQRRFERRDAR